MDLHGFSWIFFKVYTFKIWRKKSEKENSNIQFRTSIMKLFGINFNRNYSIFSKKYNKNLENN